MNTDNFLIEDRDLELARNICKIIDNADTRNRAVANAVAANIAAKYFDTEQYNIDTTSGLHNIGNVLEDIDISDIYINNSYIDVRLFFNDDNLNVPKSHFDNNLLPLAYMFIKVTPDLSGAETVGFIIPENIDKSNIRDNVYVIQETALVSFYDIESRILNTDDPCNVEEKEIFDYLDGKIENKNDFYRKLIASEEGRLRLAKAAKAKYIFQFISVPKQETAEVSSSDDFEAAINMDSDDLTLDLTQDNENLLEDSDNIDTLEELAVNEETNDNLEIEENFADELVVEDSSEENILENEAEEPFSNQNVSEEIEEIVIDETEDENVSEPSEVINEQVDDSFEFTTTTTPSIDSIDDTYEELLHDDENEGIEQQTTNVPSAEENSTGNNKEQIAALFDETSEDQDDNENEIPMQKAKSGGSAKFLTIIGLLVVLGAAGYFGYTKFMPQATLEEDSQTNVIAEANTEDSAPKIDKPETAQEAMPVESVNSAEPISSGNEASSVSIPSIEQNLDASILVSNLKVDWEVPAGYASNSSAKRYLVKLGKIIQLNLKTELLLLNKPPLTNKIAVEIKFNNENKKFETVDIITSSGEESVDQLIKQTVDKALAMNLSMNTNSFSKLQGNPVLIIRL